MITETEALVSEQTAVVALPSPQAITSLDQLLPVESTLTLRNPITDAEYAGPDGEPLTVSMVGVNSAEFFKESVASKKRNANAGAKAQDPQFRIDDRAHLLAACVTGWSHESVFGKFSKEAVFDLFRKPQAQMLADQIEHHIVKLENFFVK